jgi:hypothetical protein
MIDLNLGNAPCAGARAHRLTTVLAIALGAQLLASGPAAAACVSPLTPGSALTPGSQLSLTCQTSNGGTPATPGGSLVNNLPAIPGSFFYGHGYGSPTMPIEGPPPPGFGFYDDYVFSIAGATANSITSTIDLGTLQVSDLQVRLYGLAGNELPTFGVPSGTVYSAWSTPISGHGLSGRFAVIPDTVLGAGTYVLEVRGNVTGANGGSYSGTLNLQPVPLPAAAWLLISGMALLGVGVKRRPS